MESDWEGDFKVFINCINFSIDRLLSQNFLSFAFVLFGQKQTTNNVEQKTVKGIAKTPIVLPFKGIGNKLNDSLLLENQPDCKILIDTTKRFWVNLKEHFTADSIQDAKAVLDNLDSIIRISANLLLQKMMKIPL